MAKLPGSAWVEGNNIHFIAETTAVEYYYTGDDQGLATGALPGFTWIDGDYLYYIDTSSHKRRLAGINDATGISALVGCIWVEGARVKGTVTGVNKRNFHYDTAHSDVAHSDAHTDSGGGHDDSHADSYSDNGAHSDSHGDSHSDLGYCDAHYDVETGASHQDVLLHPECYGDYTPVGEHGDAHLDKAHGDIHADEHVDSGGHSDSHSDSHGDSASHSDTHDDVAHTDTAHVDQPIEIGA